MRNIKDNIYEYLDEYLEDIINGTTILMNSDKHEIDSLNAAAKINENITSIKTLIRLLKDEK